MLFCMIKGILKTQHNLCDFQSKWMKNLMIPSVSWNVKLIQGGIWVVSVMLKFTKLLLVSKFWSSFKQSKVIFELHSLNSRSYNYDFKHGVPKYMELLACF